MGNCSKLTTKGREYIRYTFQYSEDYLNGFGAIYKLIEQSKVDFLLTSKVRIERDLKKSNAQGIENWFVIQEPNKWKNITGLRECGNRIFYGDKRGKGKQKSLLLFQLSSDNRTLIIDSFRGFYPHANREDFINSHQFKF